MKLLVQISPEYQGMLSTESSSPAEHSIFNVYNSLQISFLTNDCHIKKYSSRATQVIEWCKLNHSKK